MLYFCDVSNYDVMTSLGKSNFSALLKFYGTTTIYVAHYCMTILKNKGDDNIEKKILILNQIHWAFILNERLKVECS